MPVRLAKEGAMSDDVVNRGPRDRERISLDQSWELHYWMSHFDVSEAKLREAVDTVGPMTAAVAKRLAGRH